MVGVTILLEISLQFKLELADGGDGTRRCCIGGCSTVGSSRSRTFMIMKVNEQIHLNSFMRVNEQLTTD